MPRRRALSALVALACAITCACSDPALARGAVVRSFDGTRIVTHFYGAQTPGPGGRAPTVLVGAGFGKAGNTSPNVNASDAIGLAALRASGYNVLTWDPRGIGGSGATVMFDSPDFEARDVSALIDFVAAQPEALLDAAGDPRVGMSGFSYGGGIQLVSAAVDPRIDAIVPDGSWHSLATSFFKDGAVKAGWLSLICAGGETTALAGGLFFTGGTLELGGTAPALRQACLEAVAGGRPSAASRQWLADRGPGELVNRVRAPTLIAQGTTDVLFPPSEAIANYDRLRANGVAVKMVWYCGGHGTCLTPAGKGGHLTRAALSWLDRWLKRDSGVDTGPSFEWVADDGVWRGGPDFPLASAGTLDAAGAGTLTVTPVDSVTSGLFQYATPALVNAVDARFHAPSEGADVIGEPRLRLTYRGTALPARTFLYAQVVDAAGQRVAGVQVTPIPVILDGTSRTVERPLEPLALRAGPGSDLRLQITAGTAVYGLQRSVGTVRLQSVQGSLPLVDATRSGRPSTGAAAAMLRTARRFWIRATSRRVGARSRVMLRSRLLSQPCSGTVRFTVRSGAVSRIVRVPVASTCAIRAVVQLPVRPGRRARITARFEGNSELAPRRARSIVRRLR